jgi:hypothetical protein
VYAISRVWVNQDGLKLNGTYQLLVYVEDIDILGRSVRTMKTNTEVLEVASKENGLEGNADKAKYKVMYRNQSAGRRHIIELDNSSFERVEEFKYLGITLSNQNPIQEEIKSGLKSGNACYYSVQNLLSSDVLPKNLKIKICRTIVLRVAFMGVELGRSH